jgi:hypothetical protein
LFPNELSLWEVKAFALDAKPLALAAHSRDYFFEFAAMSQANGIAVMGLPFSSCGV